MIRIIANNIIRFMFLLMVQAMIVNRINIMDGFVLPFIYIFAILMLPLHTPRWLVLVIAFATGLIMDMFTSTPGMHASACLVMGFLQPYVQRLLSPREGYEFTDKATIQSLGLTWYAMFAGVLTLIHHLTLFNIEFFKFEGLAYTLLTALASALGTLILMIVGQYLIFNPKKQG
ncbi:MAG: rod shape-determining protein MreD [Flavobacteriales bacterium]|jgi:rod shape-determining protein MreD